ncbi:MAG: hypothetical protein ACRC1K_09600, partial [Planctomycetia bacterium]
TLRALLSASGVGGRVVELLEGKTSGPPFVRQLVTGTVCADLLDYLSRDALHCGLKLAFDERLMNYFHLADGKLVVRLHKDGLFRRDALSELIHLLQLRYTLTERVYYHHAKAAAGAMVSRALELALAAGAMRREELDGLRDDAFLYRLEQLGPSVTGLSDVVGDLTRRRLYKRVYLLALGGFGGFGVDDAARDKLATKYHADLANRNELERRIADRLKIPESHVVVYCPSARMSLKEADVPVEVAPGRVEPLSALRHPDVAALSEKHRGLWRFYVFLRQDHAVKFRDAGEACEEEIGLANQLGPQAAGRMMLDW